MLRDPARTAADTLSAAITELADAAAPNFHDPKHRAEFVARVVQQCVMHYGECINGECINGSDTLNVDEQWPKKSPISTEDTNTPWERSTSTHDHPLAMPSFHAQSTNADSMNARSLLDPHRVRVSQDLTKLFNEDGDKMINDYAMLATLGRGSVGKVKLAVHTTTDEVRAVKIMNKSLLKRVMKGDGMTALTQVQQEVAIMKKLNHRNIVRMHEVIDDPQENKMYIVMDYVADGPLFGFERDTGACPVMPVLDIRRVMRQMCAGLMYLHRHGIVHRDIKPDNILIDKKTQTVYLSDFGVSEICGDGTKGLVIAPTMEGTPMYMAPEVYSVSESAVSSLDGERLDVWAWGVTLYCMMYGRHPFMAHSLAEARELITKGTLDIPRMPPTPDAAEHAALWDGLVALLTRMLERDPTQRATVQEVRTALRALGASNRNDSLSECNEVAAENDPIEPNVSDVKCSIGLASHSVVCSSVRARLGASISLLRPDDGSASCGGAAPVSPWLVPMRPTQQGTPRAPRTHNNAVTWESDVLARDGVGARDPEPITVTTCAGKNDVLFEERDFRPTMFTPEPLRYEDDACSTSISPAETAVPDGSGRGFVGRMRALSLTTSERSLPQCDASDAPSASFKTTADSVDLDASATQTYPFVSLLTAALAAAQ